MNGRRIFWYMILLIALLGGAAAVFNAKIGSNPTGAVLPPEPYSAEVTLPPEILP